MDADRAARRGDADAACALYVAAAQRYAAVAEEVPAELPRTRADLRAAAAASAERACQQGAAAMSAPWTCGHCGEAAELWNRCTYCARVNVPAAEPLA